MSEQHSPPEPDDAGGDARLIRWALSGTLALSFVTFCLSLSHHYWPIRALLRFYPEWSFWLVAIQGLGVVALLAGFGWPATLHTWMSLILLNVWLLTVSAVYQWRAVEMVLAVAADFLLRVSVLAVWSTACLGAPCAAVWIWRHRYPPRPPFRFGRWWLSALVLLLAAEPLMLFFDRDKDALSWPAGMPDPPPQEMRIAAIG